METKTCAHSPAPWSVTFEQEEEFEGESNPDYGRLTVESEFGCVALVGPLGPVKDDEDRANARLIAAAPDMLALLERFVEVARKLDNTGLHHVIMDEERDGRALLAKLA